MSEGAPRITPLLFESRVPAGFPSPAEGHCDQALDLNELMVPHPEATFFVRVEGRSMEGAHIFSGDILVIDRSLTPTHGDIIVAVVNGEFTVKRIELTNHRCVLVAENPAYPPLEIKEGQDFQVWGIVTYIIHKAH